MKRLFWILALAAALTACGDDATTDDTPAGDVTTDTTNDTAGDADVTEPGDADVTDPGDADVVEPGDADVVEPGDADVVEPGDADVVHDAETVGDTATGCTSDDDCAQAAEGGCEAYGCDLATGQCVAGPAADGTTCMTGDLCISAEICTAGVCGGGNHLTCEQDDNPCTTMDCASETGECASTNGENGTECGEAQSCWDGACVKTPVCGDGVVDAGEGCDDSNTDTEACAYDVMECTVCDATCQEVAGAVSYCGDENVDSDNGEDCDSGEANTADCAYGAESCVVCNACQTLTGATHLCGDDTLDEDNEACDDGNTSPGDGCSLSCGVENFSVGDIIFTEFMANPCAFTEAAAKCTVLDDDGEWIEIYNTTDTDIDINGWLLQESNDNPHIVTDGVSVIVPAGDYAVLTKHCSSEENGGIEPDYCYPGDVDGGFVNPTIVLNNGKDKVELVWNDLIIDTLDYDDTKGWFHDEAISTQLHIDKLDGVDNNDGANWCGASATSTYGPGGDVGTPGAENTGCP